MANRDAKDWLESIILDENLISHADPSATDVVSQSSVSAAVDTIYEDMDNVIDELDSHTHTVEENAAHSVTMTTLSPEGAHTLATGNIYFIDSVSVTSHDLTLPAIGGSYGDRIVIYVRRNAGGINFLPNGAEGIQGSSTHNTTASYLRFTLVGVGGGAADSWIIE